MQFLANENISGPGIALLRNNGIDLLAIAETHRGIADSEVMRMAIEQKRTILTHDSDYGELIFKHGYRPPAGVVFFRIYDFEPDEPAQMLLDLIRSKINFHGFLTVVDASSVRQRPY